MSDRPANDPSTDWVDPERERATKPFDQPHGQFGEEYDVERERAVGARRPSGTVDPHGASGPAQRDGRDLPPDNGQRASFDPRTGEVRGSGVGAGGGAEGEDFDDDSTSGSGYPFTGAEQRDDQAPADPGPAHFKQ